jgi:choline dehydrogenase-like flavoprotein
MQHNPTI